MPDRACARYPVLRLMGGLPADTMSLADASQVLGIDVSRLRRLAARGILPATKVGRDWITTRRDVEQFAALERRPGWPRGRPRRPPYS